MDDEFLIRFGGENHIRVETLTEFLEKYRFLLYRINENLGYSPNDLIVQVSPPENGSFKIRLNPKYESQILNTISGIVAGTLSGLILTWTVKSHSLTKEDIAQVIENHDYKQKKEIVHQVYNTYQQVDVQQAINQTFQIVYRDENIESLDISQNEKPIIEIPKSRFEQLIKPDSEFEKIETTEQTVKFDIEEVSIIIKTVHFEGNAKWGFIWRGYPIKATIKDEIFLKKLSNEPFRRGDILCVRLKKKSCFNKDLNTYIVDETSYEIEEVLNHKTKTNNDHYELGLND